VNPPRVSLSELLREFRPGRSIYIPGASAELRCLQQLLSSEPASLAQVTLVSCLLPGMNGFDYAGLHPDCCIETFLLPPALRPSFVEGRVSVIPLTYSGIAAHLATRRIDLALLHVTPSHEGLCSFGIAADFGPIVARSARRRVGILNPRMPRPLNSPTIALESFDAVVYVDEPLITASVPLAGPDLHSIARHAATLIPNGATLQIGIGQAPGAIWDALHGHKALRLWSGVVTDGFLSALDSGVMVASGHVAGFAHGSAELYARLDGSEVVTFADVRTTHSAARLGQIDRLVAINSALEIDLFGQVNLEWQSGRLVSGVGGAPDFNAAACRSAGGRSIVAMPATARNGSISRISARLSAPTASLSRTEVDTVVTEFGTASLAGLSLDGRARALIAIAAPAHRASLEHVWAEQRRDL